MKRPPSLYRMSKGTTGINSSPSRTEEEARTPRGRETCPRPELERNRDSQEHKCHPHSPPPQQRKSFNFPPTLSLTEGGRGGERWSQERKLSQVQLRATPTSPASKRTEMTTDFDTCRSVQTFEALLYIPQPCSSGYCLLTLVVTLSTFELSLLNHKLLLPWLFCLIMLIKTFSECQYFRPNFTCGTRKEDDKLYSSESLGRKTVLWHTRWAGWDPSSTSYLQPHSPICEQGTSWGNTRGLCRFHRHPVSRPDFPPSPPPTPKQEKEQRRCLFSSFLFPA